MHKVIINDFKEIINSDCPFRQFENSSVLITGAGGFLPAYFVNFLIYLNENTFKRPVQIYALIRKEEKAVLRFKDFLQKEYFHLLIQDVIQPLNCNVKFDFIVHAASQASPKYYGVDPVGTLNSNILGTNNLLEYSLKNGTGCLLFFSSAEVYGSLPNELVPIKESSFGYIDISNIRSCYSESKRMAEVMCISWHNQYKIPVKIIRPFHTYGPGMDLADGRVFADFVSDILNDRDIVMKSFGSSKRAFCYLRDATKAFITVLMNGKNGEAYNVGNPDQEVSIFELANILTTIYPEKKLKVIVNQPENIPLHLRSPVERVSPNIEKIKGLGWVPEITIKEGFNRTIESFR